MAKIAAFGCLLDGVQHSFLSVIPFLAALGLLVRLLGHYGGISHLQLSKMLQLSNGCQGIPSALPLKCKECSTLSQAILLKLTSMFAFAGNADIGEHLHGAVWICGSCPVVRRHCGPLRSQAAERYILLSAHFHVRVRPSACSCLAWRMANIKLFVGQSFLICFLYALAHRLCLLVGWHSLHAAVSSAVSIRSSNIKKLLDPIKSGVILLPSSRRLQLGAGSPC